MLARMIIILKRQRETNAGKDVEKTEPSCTADGNVNGYSHYWKWYGGSSKKF